MGNCLGYIQCIQLLKNIDNDYDNELLDSNLINEPSEDIDNKRKIFGFSKKENLAEIIELPQKDHPFFLGTQGHPEYKSRPLRPHPIFVKFIKACKS